MTTTQTAPELETFLLWFLQNEDIPVGLRQRLAEYLQQVDGLDTKAVTFIDAVLELMIQRGNARVEALGKELKAVQEQIAQEHDPATSIRVSTANQAVTRMNQLVEDYKAEAASLDQEEEAAQEAISQQEVEALKETLD